MTEQRYWEDVIEGEDLASLSFPLTVYRLVMAAGASRDFNSIHHNSEFAKSTGAPEMYANNYLLQGMWERAVRQYIGNKGVIRQLRGFRMRNFNVVGDTVVVKGRVVRKWLEDVGLIELEMWSENANGVSVGPGRVIAMLPTERQRNANLAGGSAI
ncbi:acyl dehydratase [Pseudomonas sp. MWU12-2312b]|uniref:MaoC/PaaZ C-terminal domain-containing protein n=1 Tax=Pseudomonas moorei TaxID=395599 RepID=UPI000D4198E8|nr:MaoC/PaaZ C-terminal domain-containing protein [Pseudomonas moorei]PPA01931.1 acyl dehydratase [Pseudomonas sp. MWU12-2312b]